MANPLYDDKKDNGIPNWLDWARSNKQNNADAITMYENNLPALLPEEKLDYNAEDVYKGSASSPVYVGPDTPSSPMTGDASSSTFLAGQQQEADTRLNALNAKSGLTSKAGDASSSMEDKGYTVAPDGLSLTREHRPGYVWINDKEVNIAQHLADNEPTTKISEFLANPRRPFKPNNIAEASIAGAIKIDNGMAVSRATRKAEEDAKIAKKIKEDAAKKAADDSLKLENTAVYQQVLAASPERAKTLGMLAPVYEQNMKDALNTWDEQSKIIDANRPDVSPGFISYINGRHDKDVRDANAMKKAGRGVEVQLQKRLDSYNQIHKWETERKTHDNSKTTLGNDFFESKAFKNWQSIDKDLSTVAAVDKQSETKSWDDAARALHELGTSGKNAIGMATSTGSVIPAKAMMDAAKAGLLTNADAYIEYQDARISDMNDPALSEAWKNQKVLFKGFVDTKGNNKASVMQGYGPDKTFVYQNGEEAEKILASSSSLEDLDSKLSKSSISDSDKTAVRSRMRISQGERGQAAMEQRIAVLSEKAKTAFESLIPAFQLDMQNPQSALAQQIMSSPKDESVLAAIYSRIAAETGMGPVAVESMLGKGNSQFMAQASKIVQQATNMRNNDVWKRAKQDYDWRRLAGVSNGAMAVSAKDGSMSFVTVHDVADPNMPELTMEQIFDQKNVDPRQVNAFNETIKGLIEDDPATLKSWGVQFRGTTDKNVQRIVIPTVALENIKNYARVEVPDGFTPKEASILREAGSVLHDAKPSDAGRRRTDLITALGGEEKYAAMLQDENLIPKDVAANAPSLLKDGFKSNRPAVREAAILGAMEAVFVTKADQLGRQANNMQIQAFELLSSMGFSENYTTKLRQLLLSAEKLPIEQRDAKFEEILNAFTDTGVRMIKESSDPKGMLSVKFKGKASPNTHINIMASNLNIAAPLKKELDAVAPSEDNKTGSPNIGKAFRLDKRAQAYYRMAKAFHDATLTEEEVANQTNVLLDRPFQAFRG